jgi:CBS domain containing-hemolysin-like protein
VSLWLGLGIVLALIAINGFFVAGEFALVAVNRSRVESRAAEGDRRATRLLGRLKDLSFELSGAQLGITVTSLIIGALAEDTVAELIGPALDRIGISSASAALIIALVLATVFQMVFGELFPKNVAIARAYPTAIRIGLPMASVNRLLRPLIGFFNAAANWTVRRIGIEPRDELAGLRSLQELEMIVRASSEEGELDAERSSLLARAIGFVERDAAEAMVPRVDIVGLPQDASVADMRALSVRTGHSRFPVFAGDLDSIVGIAHVKDTFEVPAARRDATPVADVAVTAHVVPEAIHLDSLLLDLQRARRSIAVVADEYGGTAGIVTIEDIVEEILGEIEDEHDAPGRVRRRGLLSGGLHRHEVEERTGFEWPEGNYETLSGFVTDRLERFPEAGDVVEASGHQIEVVSVDGNVASWLRMRGEGGDDT